MAASYLTGYKSPYRSLNAQQKEREEAMQRHAKRMALMWLIGTAILAVVIAASLLA